jgi:hypothetical protein
LSRASASDTNEVIRGELKEMFDPYHVNFPFAPVPGKEGEQCIAGWKAEFEPISSSTAPLPENAKDVPPLGSSGSSKPAVLPASSTCWRCCPWKKNVANSMGFEVLNNSMLLCDNYACGYIQCFFF